MAVNELWSIDALMSAVLEIMPNAIFDTDASGEIIISTGWTVISSTDDIAPIKGERK